MLENKWRHGLVRLVLPPLAPWALKPNGIKPVSLIIDHNVGPEFVLLIAEPRELALEFQGQRVTRFQTVSGLARTSFGPVCWLLFYFVNPVTGEQMAYENVLNPKDDAQMRIYEQLGEQRYWHVIIADVGGEVTNFYEFANIHGLAEALQRMRHVCSEMSVVDFVRAKAEFQATCSMDDLLRETGE